MTEYQPGDRVEVDISAGIIPGAQATPDWQPGTIAERLTDGRYRVRLDQPIGGRAADKEAAAEHIRRTSG